MERENAVKAGLLLIAMAYGCYSGLSRHKADLKMKKAQQDWLVRHREQDRAFLDRLDEIRASYAKKKDNDGASA